MPVLSQPRVQGEVRVLRDSQSTGEGKPAAEVCGCGLTPRTSCLPKAKTDGASFALKGLACPLLVIT